MLDTEQKVDQFLALLKTEIMAARMEEGVIGPYVTAKSDQDAAYCQLRNETPALINNSTIWKRITVNIAVKPLTIITYTPDLRERGLGTDIGIGSTVTTGKIDADTSALYDLGTGTMEQLARPLVDDSLNDGGYCA